MTDRERCEAYLRVCQRPDGPGMPESLTWDPYAHHRLDDHEALCLCAEHVRAWLAERGWHVQPGLDERVCRWWVYARLTPMLERPDFHLAQVAAVEAALERSEA